MPYAADGMTWEDEDTGSPAPQTPSTSLGDAYRNIGKSPDGLDVYEGPGGQLFTPGRRNINSGAYETWNPYTGAKPGGTAGAPGGTATSGGANDWSKGNWDAARVESYFKSRGVSPNGGSAQYWADRWNEWGKNDPGYFLQRLSTADEFGGGGSGGGGAPNGTLLQPWGGQFTPPTPNALPGAPSFNPPAFRQAPAFTYDQFKAPTADDVLADPSYKFRLGEGEQALQGSAAARGLLNTGGTLKDILRYGQQFASNEYGNIYNRDLSTYQTGFNNALNAYGTNYGSQYADPYRAQYQAATDQYAPQMTAYQNQFNATNQNNQLDYQHAYDAFTGEYDRWDKQRKFVFDTLADQQKTGLGAN